MAGRIVGADRARDAARRESRAGAYEELRALDLAHMEPCDLEALADAAWWLSRSDESIAARQRAYAGYVAAGENPRAAWCAGRLCMEHFFRNEPAVAAGWLMRARRLLREQPERVQHGYVAMVESNLARARGETDEAVACAERATEIGLRFGDPDVVAMGIHLHGLALIDAGRVAEGMALLDEAMASVVAGELGTFFTGVVYCNVIAVCLEVSDVGRLGEWNDAARQWCESLPSDAPFPAICRVNRAEAASLRGAWPEAEAEASRASRELGFNPQAAARAFYETGEIRRRIGDLAGAEEAFARAHELGLPSQPGLALLRLAQRKPDAALQALRAAVADERAGWPRRARLLAALVEVALAAGDLDTARQASRELDEIADRLDTPALTRRRRPRAGRCGWPRATCRGPWSACAPPVRPGRSSGCPTRPRRRGCCTAPRCAVPEAMRTLCWSCARLWPRSSGSAPPATRARRPCCSAGARSCPAG